MNNNNLTISIKRFNDKLKIMNQSGARDLTLTAQEARGLHSDIFELMSMITTLSASIGSNPEPEKIVQVSMSGGTFR